MMIPRGTYSNELFEVEVEDFNKNYEFYEKIGIDELVKHKESKLIYKVLAYGHKVQLLQVSNEKAMDKFSNLKGALTKIILESGFKPSDK